MIHQQTNSDEVSITISPALTEPVKITRVKPKNRTIAQMSYDELRQRAKTSQPPRSWYDEIIPDDLLG